MSFNFKGVEAAKSGNYLKPGYYRARVSKVEAGEFEQSGIPYLAVTFQTQDGLEITEKFTLKTKDPKSKFNPLSRLQYLHEAWLGAEIDADFKSIDQLTEFFQKALVGKKAGAKTIVVGGEVNGKVTYGRIPLTDFVISEEVDLGEFEEGSEEWKQFVKKSTRTTEATGKKGGLLNSAEDDDDFGGEDDDKEEIPAPKKKTGGGAAKAEKTTAKKPAAKPAKEEAEDDNDGDGEGDGFNW